MSVEKREILHVVRRALSAIDPRLIDHGERVAYLADNVALYLPAGAAVDRDRLFTLCALHDIGAYKTEEIDNMVQFESDSVRDHALFGYLFLRQAAALGDSAEAILDHHTPYERVKREDKPFALYANCIHLADRVDIATLTGHDAVKSVVSHAGTLFDPLLVDAFLRADAALSLREALRTGAYRAYCNERIEGLQLNGTQVSQYLQLLVYAIDFRSEVTVTHTAGVVAFAEALGQRLGLDESSLNRLRMGAFLHDVGKIAIPTSILEKQGRLTPAEMDRMRKHVEYTERILRGFVSDEICDIACRHHEKLDGSGYPYGLTAKDLTLSQRILAVADILSALTGRRSYKEPYPKEETLRLLHLMEAEGQLCPRVCAVLFEQYDAILQEADPTRNPIVRLYENMKAEFTNLREQAH